MKEIATRKFNDAGALIFDKNNSPGINLKSINDILDLCEYNDIDPKTNQHLIITYYMIEDLYGIQRFENLRELNLIGNWISTINGGRIAISVPMIILFILYFIHINTGNDILKHHPLRWLNIL